MLKNEAQSIPTYYLKPGEMYLSQKPAIITTIIGSCLCVTMHMQSKLSSICHAVLPNSREAQMIKGTFQYVDTSIEWMLDQFNNNGIKPGEIEIKMFGGAEIYSGGYHPNNSTSVGWNNIDAALDVFEKNIIKLKTWSIGGNKGRRLVFNTLTGEVAVKFVSKADVPKFQAAYETKP